jgi:hypothetical protein
VTLEYVGKFRRPLNLLPTPKPKASESLGLLRDLRAPAECLAGYSRSESPALPLPPSRSHETATGGTNQVARRSGSPVATPLKGSTGERPPASPPNSAARGLIARSPQVDATIVPVPKQPSRDEYDEVEG